MDEPSLLLPLNIISAGFPSPGVEWRERKLTINQLLGIAGEESYSLIMAGTALSGAGILDGDLLVFSRGLEPISNDIVLATVNGSLYVRRFVAHRGSIFLLPADIGTLPVRIERGDIFKIKGVALCRFHALHPTFKQKMRHRNRNVSDLNLLLELDAPETVVSRVKGSSMQGSGIYDGDVLIISREHEAVQNDIIIASLDGSLIVKRLAQVQGTTFLLSENPLMPPLIATVEQGFQVWGVVKVSLHPLHEVVKQRLLARKNHQS